MGSGSGCDKKNYKDYIEVIWSHGANRAWKIEEESEKTESEVEG